jgi:hypothetical protein
LVDAPCEREPDPALLPVPPDEPDDVEVLDEVDVPDESDEPDEPAGFDDESLPDFVGDSDPDEPEESFSPEDEPPDEPEEPELELLRLSVL